MTPQCLELSLVLNSQALAQLDEVTSRDRHLVGSLDGLALATGVRGDEVGVVGQGRVAAHAEVVLHAALGGQAVVIPAHGVEDGHAAHALVTSDGVSVGVGEDVAHVQGAGDRGRRGVDGVDLMTLGGAVEGVGAVLLPALAPGGLQTVGADLAGDSGAVELGGEDPRRGLSSRHGPDSVMVTRESPKRAALPPCEVGYDVAPRHEHPGDLAWRTDVICRRALLPDQRRARAMDQAQ